MWPIRTNLESSVFGEEGSNCDAAVVDFRINQQCSMCAMPVEVYEFIYRKSLVWKEITIKAIWCGWHALLESECKHLCQCVDVDGYEKLNRYPGVGNIERSKISLPSDSTCDASSGCHSSIHCPSSIPEDQYSRSLTLETGWAHSPFKKYSQFSLSITQHIYTPYKTFMK